MFKELNNLRLFFEFPSREYNVRDVARNLKIAPATASKELKILAKKGILKRRVYKNFNFYQANLESDLYKDLKLFNNIRQIKESGFLNAINKFYLKPSITIFGSASFGMDNETSDIDILIISESTKKFLELNKYEKLLNRKIQLFIVNDIRDLRNKHLINNVINGIVIQGHIKWI